MELFFFLLGLVNSILLIAIFLVRKSRLDLLRRFGWAYLLLAFPAVYCLIAFVRERNSARYAVFLVIFFVFLLAEWVCDHLLKIDFRADLKKNWKIGIPYLLLYYSMNYGFIVMPWRSSVSWGAIMLGFFAIQMAANLSSHPKAYRQGK